MRRQPWRKLKIKKEPEAIPPGTFICESDKFDRKLLDAWGFPLICPSSLIGSKKKRRPQKSNSDWMKRSNKGGRKGMIQDREPLKIPFSDASGRGRPSAVKPGGAAPVIFGAYFQGSLDLTGLPIISRYDIPSIFAKDHLCYNSRFNESRKKAPSP